MRWAKVGAGCFIATVLFACSSSSATPAAEDGGDGSAGSTGADGGDSGYGLHGCPNVGAPGLCPNDGPVPKKLVDACYECLDFCLAWSSCQGNIQQVCDSSGRSTNPPIAAGCESHANDCIGCYTNVMQSEAPSDAGSG
jgi:hypothetical protein